MFGPCFVNQNFVPFLCCNRLGGEERAGCFILLIFLVSCLGTSVRHRGLVCGVLWGYFLIILTFFRPLI